MLRPPFQRVPFRLAAALLLATVAPAVTLRPARAQEPRYTRPLDVPAAGWVRVPLAPEIVRRIGAGAGLQLFGPAGAEVAFVHRPAVVPPAWRPAEVLAPEPGEDVWWLPLEVASDAGLHERLALGPEGAAALGPAPAVRLEASADGATWRLVAVGEMEAADGRLSLAYPATDLRRLRLGWPRRAGEPGPPRFAEAAVEEVPLGAFRVSVASSDCRSDDASPGAHRTVCRLPVGGAGRHLRRLCFTVAGDAPAAYRLSTPRAGRWEAVAESAWGAPVPEAPRCARLDAAEVSTLEPLRLELFGAGRQAPSVRDATAGFAPEVLLFEAKRAGVHTLAYGPGVLPGAPVEGAAMPPGVEPAVVVPGPEESSEVPASALALPAAAGPAPVARFAETWEVAAERPEPGQLHRLTLPPAVYEVAAPDLSDLRLLVPEGGSRLQVPYVLWRPEEPALVVERRGIEPDRPERGGSTSRVVVGAPESDLPISALSMSAPAAGPGQVWERRARVRAPGADDGEERPAGPWVDWACAPRPPLPCRVTLPLEERGAGPWVVEIDDGGAAPLSAVDLELWRRRDVLLFPWPAEGATPVLAAGAEGLEAPEFELSRRRDELVARPWREASLVLDGDRGGGLGAVAITLALIAAAVALLVLLDRTLAEQVPGRRRP